MGTCTEFLGETLVQGNKPQRSERGPCEDLGSTMDRVTKTGIEAFLEGRQATTEMRKDHWEHHDTCRRPERAPVQGALNC